MITLYYKIKTRALQYISYYSDILLQKQGFNRFIFSYELSHISHKFSYEERCFFNSQFPKGTTVGKLIKKIYEGDNKYYYSGFAVCLYQVFKLSGVTKSYYTEERYMFQENTFEDGKIIYEKNYNKDGKLIMVLDCGFNGKATWFNE